MQRPASWRRIWGSGLGSGALVCVPVPADVALPDDVARDAVARAIADAEAEGIVGPGGHAVAARPDR